MELSLKKNLGSRWDPLAVVLGVILLSFLISLLPAPPGLGVAGTRTLAILFGTLILWITEALEPTVTSILVIGVIPLSGILSFPETTAAFGSPILWLLLGVLIFSLCLNSTGLDRRIAFSIMNLARGKSNLLLLSVMACAVLFIFMVPMAIGRASIMIPVCQGLAANLNLKKGSRLAKGIFIATPFVAAVSSIGVMTGANAVVYAVGLFSSSIDYTWDYVSWMSAFFPLVVLIVLGLWLTMLLLFPPEVKVLNRSITYISGELTKLGPMSRQEKRLALLFVLMICLWLTRAWHGIPLELSSILVSVLLLFPKIGILDWHQVKSGLNWGIFFMFGSSLAIAKALEKSGVISWLAGMLSGVVSGHSPFVIALIVMGVMIGMRLTFTTMIGEIVTMLPVTFGLAAATGLNPVWLGMVAVAAASISFLMPMQAPENMLSYALGYFSPSDMFKAGVIGSVIVITVTLASAMFYWPLLGIHPLLAITSK